MAVNPDGTKPEPGSGASIDELQADIDVTRQELGETVSALVDKVDVKSRVQHKAAETKDAAVQQVHAVQQTVKRNPRLDIAVLAVIAATVGAVVWLRRRNR